MFLSLLLFLPCIAYAHGKLRPVVVECDARHRCLELRVLAQSLLEFVVPDRDRPVGPRRGKRVVAEGIAYKQ